MKWKVRRFDWGGGISRLEPEERRLSRAFLAISLVIGTGMAFLILLRLAQGRQNTIPAMAAVFVAMLASFILARRGHRSLASSFVLWSLLGFFAKQMLSNDGIHDTVIVAVPGLIVISGLLLGNIGFAVFFFGSVALVWITGNLELHGLVAGNRAVPATVTELADLTVVFLATATSVRLMVQGLRSGLQRARESEARYKCLLETSPDPIVMLDHEGKVIFASRRAYSLVGAESGSGLLGKSFLVFLREEDRERARASYRVMMEGKLTPRIDCFELLRLDGAKVWVEVDASLLMDPSGMAKELLLVCRDVTSRKSEEAARARELAFLELLSSTSSRFLVLGPSELDEGLGQALDEIGESCGIDHVALFVVSDDGTMVKMVNERVAAGLPAFMDRYNALGPAASAWTMEQIRGGEELRIDSIEDLPPEAAFERALCERTGLRSSLLIPFRDRKDALLGCVSFAQFGSERMLSEENHRFLRLIGGVFASAIGRARTELAMKESLREKELLLKEIHHRVKNNLQVVSSLLSLAAEEAASENARDLFLESMDRVYAMSLVHEQLYTSRDVASIDFGEYLETIAGSLARSARRGGVSCIVEAEPIPLGIDEAIPCGLIVNELVTNAYKHAFNGRAKGRVSIGLRRAESGKIELSVADDGIGIPSGEAILARHSMGMTLLSSLSLQLHGKLRVESGSGSRFILSFPGTNFVSLAPELGSSAPSVTGL